jgi:predicted RNase H-like HicB family nuclease
VKLKIVLDKNEDHGYTVYVPSLPGCISEGDSREKALANIKEAIALYLEPFDDDYVEGEKGEILELAL